MGTGHTKRYVTSVELTEVGVEAIKRASTREQNQGRDEEVIYSRDLNHLAPARRFVFFISSTVIVRQGPT
jgi:hypothetical protein